MELPKVNSAIEKVCKPMWDKVETLFKANQTAVIIAVVFIILALILIGYLMRHDSESRLKTKPFTSM